MAVAPRPKGAQLNASTIYVATAGCQPPDNWRGEPGRRQTAGAYCLTLEVEAQRKTFYGTAYVRAPEELYAYAIIRTRDIKGDDDADDCVGPAAASLTFVAPKAGFASKLTVHTLGAITQEGLKTNKQAYVSFEDCWKPASLFFHSSASSVREAQNGDERRILNDLAALAKTYAAAAKDNPDWPSGLAEEGECGQVVT